MSLLIALCASHMNNMHRWNAFVSMIESWSQQSQPLYLYVSMSYIPEMKAFVQTSAREIARKFPSLRIFLSADPKSQFEHYKKLASYVQEFVRSNETHTEKWIIFCDDDDLWAPLRSTDFLLGVEQIEESGCNATCVLMSATACGTNDTNVSTWEEVDKLIHDSTIVVDLPNSTHKSGNYVSYAVRLSTLVNFTAVCSAPLLRHKFCDMAFVRHLRAPTASLVLCNPDGWRYFYRLDTKIEQACCMDGADAIIVSQSNIDLYLISRGACELSEFYEHSRARCSIDVFQKVFSNYLEESKHLATIPLLCV